MNDAILNAERMKGDENVFNDIIALLKIFFRFILMFKIFIILTFKYHTLFIFNLRMIMIIIFLVKINNLFYLIENFVIF